MRDDKERYLDDTMLGLIYFFGAVIALGLLASWMYTDSPPLKPAVTQPVEKTENPYPQFPKLNAHCNTCKQCANPISETGEEQGLCEDGFKLLQEDVLEAKE
jgi:hypothetical protein